MKNRPQSSQNGFPEHNERAAQHIHSTGRIGLDRPAPQIAEEQMLLDYLLEAGFSWGEAEQLLELRDHLYENAEMRQRLADNYRMHFARWLYEQQEINEEQVGERSGDMGQ